MASRQIIVDEDWEMFLWESLQPLEVNEVYEEEEEVEEVEEVEEIEEVEEENQSSSWFNFDCVTYSDDSTDNMVEENTESTDKIAVEKDMCSTDGTAEKKDN